MRVFKTKEFARFARKERIADEDLVEAVERAMRGLVDAVLGGGLIKQRVARQGQGRSGGFRTIIAWRAGERSVFVYGFAKSDRANLDAGELAVYQRLARTFLSLDNAAIARLVALGELVEIE